MKIDMPLDKPNQTADCDTRLVFSEGFDISFPSLKLFAPTRLKNHIHFINYSLVLGEKIDSCLSQEH